MPAVLISSNTHEYLHAPKFKFVSGRIKLFTMKVNYNKPKGGIFPNNKAKVPVWYPQSFNATIDC